MKDPLKNDPKWAYEREYLHQFSSKDTAHFVAGADEVGRGCLAGPVVAGMVILNPSHVHRSIDDSKRLRASQREAMSRWIKQHAMCWALGMASAEEVDALGLMGATKMAFLRAYERMSISPSRLLLDALRVQAIPVTQEALIKGDARSYSIGAASILAKVYRDKWMQRCHRWYSQYGFDTNKGYGTPSHKAALRRYGPCRLHRRCFAPVRHVLTRSGARPLSQEAFRKNRISF